MEMTDTVRNVGELRAALDGIDDLVPICLGPLVHPGEAHDQRSRGVHPRDDMHLHLSNAHGEIIVMGVSRWWDA
jgi:hypothetical protein